MTKLLLVEDDDKLGRQVLKTLTSSGYDVEWLTRGDDALGGDLDAVELVILDLMLPGAHGFDVLKSMRSRDSHVPVLVLSARPDTSDKVRAL